MPELDTLARAILDTLAVPYAGLAAMFVVAFLAATLLPLGSEPLFVALLMQRPEAWGAVLFWATLGNSLGGVLNYGLGRGAQHLARGGSEARASRWLTRFGPVACLLAWLPFVGDPLCVAAGWLRLPFWRCAVFITLGKLARYGFLAMGTVWLTQS